MSQSSTDSNQTITPTPSSRNEILYFAYGRDISPTRMLTLCPSATPVGPAFLPSFRWVFGADRHPNILPVKPYPTAKGKQKDREQFFTSSTCSIITNYDHGPQREEGVYGILYLVTPSDEISLDNSTTREKVILEVDILDTPQYPSTPTSSDSMPSTSRSTEPSEGENTPPSKGKARDSSPLDTILEIEPIPVDDIISVRALVYADFSPVASAVAASGECELDPDAAEWIRRGVLEAVPEWGLPRWWAEAILRLVG